MSIDYVEWNDPFTGYDYDDFLLKQLRLEYEQDAIHDQWKTRLQERTQLGTYKKEESRQGSCAEKFGKGYCG